MTHYTFYVVLVMLNVLDNRHSRLVPVNTYVIAAINIYSLTSLLYYSRQDYDVEKNQLVNASENQQIAWRVPCGTKQNIFP